MAEKILQKVEDELTTCSICLDTYTSPKLLQCFHVYCQGCLARLTFRDQQGQLVLTCPNCRQITPVPVSGVAGLQSAFHINHLLGIMEEYKKKRDEVATSDSISITSGTEEKKAVFCSDHSDEELKLYCETCGQLICFKCAIKGLGDHHDHKHQLLDEAYTKYKEEITLSVHPLEMQMETINQALEELGDCSSRISTQEVSLEANIQETFMKLQEALDIRKAELRGKLHQITQDKLKKLEAQKDKLETIKAQLGSCLDFMEKSMETDSPCDVLKMKASIVKQVNDLSTPFQSDLLYPCTEANTLYLTSTSALSACQSHGWITTPSHCDPSKCYAAGNSLEVASTEEKSTVILYAINHRGEPCLEPINLMECELIAEIKGIKGAGQIEKKEQSKYEVSYQPSVKGKHHLHIMVEGCHIMGSPFSVAVTSPIQKLCPNSLIQGGKWPLWSSTYSSAGASGVRLSRPLCTCVQS